MNDYKELIDKLRKAEAHMERFGIFARAVKRAEIKAVADAIEQLVKERDELYGEVMDCTKKIGCKAIEQVKKERDTAVNDLNIARSCLTCKSDGADFCDGCDSWRSKKKWEWRGVQE